MILFDGIRFIYPENLYFDTSLTLLGVVLMVLDNFDSFHRMADTHIPPILVFCWSHKKSLARKQFLDHENLCFDTFFVSLGVEIAISFKLFVFGIMAASGERHNGHLSKLYYSYILDDIKYVFCLLQAFIWCITRPYRPIYWFYPFWGSPHITRAGKGGQGVKKMDPLNFHVL